MSTTLHTAPCPGVAIKGGNRDGKYPQGQYTMWGFLCEGGTGVKKVGCVVVLGGLALVLLCNLAPGLVQQLQASPIGTLFANPFKVGDVQQSAVQAQQGEQVSTGADSVLGSPSIAVELIDRVLSAYGSPAAGTGQSLK